MNNNPIGIFDSGIGGTSIWNAITTLLPNENTIYLADSINAPYGEKSKEEIIQLSIKNTELLLSKGAKIIIVACNTATTNAIKILRENYNVPFIGIEPAIKPASLITKTKSIGILATKGTLSSALFSTTLETFTKNINVVEKEGKGIVKLIENGQLHSSEMTKLLNKLLVPMINENIDSLVLGCTHYPYLIPQIKNIIGNDVRIVDSGLAVAKQTENILKINELLGQNTNPKHQFFTNSETKILQEILVKTLNLSKNYFSIEKIKF